MLQAEADGCNYDIFIIYVLDKWEMSFYLCAAFSSINDVFELNIYIKV